MMHSHKRGLLLASACVVLLAAATPVKAVDLGWDAFVEGRFLFGFGDKPLGGINATYPSFSISPAESEQGHGPSGEVGIGYRFRDGWRAAGASMTLSRLEGQGSDALIDIYAAPIFAALIDQDLSQETESFMLDFEVGKDFGIGEGGIITAFGGLRAAWIDRNSTNELSIAIYPPPLSNSPDLVRAR